MKERIVVLARHPWAKKVINFFILLALIGLVLRTDTEGNYQREIFSRSYQWADLFCGRDGYALKGMYNPEQSEDFHQIELVQSQPEDDFVSFGWSSPWPSDGQYKILSIRGHTEITYYTMTSEPHLCIWKEWLTWKKFGKTWYVDQEAFKVYDRILTADEFKEAYGNRISDTAMDYRNNGMGNVLNEHAKTDLAYQDLLTPQLAMEYLLNLHGGYGIELTRGNTTTVLYTFSDKSQVAVTMIQPYGCDGIWIPEEVTQVPPNSWSQEPASPETLSGSQSF